MREAAGFLFFKHNPETFGESIRSRISLVVISLNYYLLEILLPFSPPETLLLEFPGPFDKAKLS